MVRRFDLPSRPKLPGWDNLFEGDDDDEDDYVHPVEDEDGEHEQMPDHEEL
jgi:hypothetical protein